MSAAMEGSSVDPWDHADWKGGGGGGQAVEHAGNQDDVSSRKLFVGNIGYRQNWKDLKDFFSKFGKVAYTQVVFDHLKKRSKGFGFVEFASKEGADKCLMAPSEELMLQGRKLRLSYANESKKSTFKIHPPVPDLTTNDDDGKEISSEQTGKDKSEMLTIDEWRIIFSYLTIPELVRVERVCRRWREMALQLWREKRDLTCRGFSFKHLLTDRVLMSLLNRCCGSLRSLNLCMSQVLTEYSMTIVGHHCPGLVKLDMSGVAATNIGLRDLSSQATGLKWIKLQRCRHVAEKGLWWLFKNCEQLEHVDFAENFAVTGKCFFMLKPSLRCMIANNCYKLADYGIQQLSQKCQHLRELNIHSCFYLTNDAIRAVATLSELEVLDAGGLFPQASLEPWSVLRNLCHLRELRLDMNLLVSDEAVQAIATGCPHLRSVNLSGCRPHVSSQGLLSLTALKHLTSLNISYIQQVTDEVLERLASRGVLERLWLHTCLDVTDTGVQQVLEQCSRLTLLDLSNNINLTRSALSPLTSDLCHSHPDRRLQIVIGGTSMLFQEAEPGASALETGLPAWVTLTRVNRANRRFNEDGMIYLPDPWSDSEEEEEEEEEEEDLQEIVDLLEEGEKAQGQGRLQEGTGGLGDGDKQQEFSREGACALDSRSKPQNPSQQGAAVLGNGDKQHLQEGASGLASTKRAQDRTLEGAGISGSGDRSPDRNIEGHEGRNRGRDGMCHNSTAEASSSVAGKRQGKEGAQALDEAGDSCGGGLVQDKTHAALGNRNHEDPSTCDMGSKGGNLPVDAVKKERADFHGAEGRSLLERGDDSAGRLQVLNNERLPVADVEDEESWEGEDVPAPVRVPQPNPPPRIGHFHDIDDDFDEDYDEYLENDDPLESERWQMS